MVFGILPWLQASCSSLRQLPRSVTLVVAFVLISLTALTAASPAEAEQFGQTAIGDLNGDGKLDLAVAVTTGGQGAVWILFQNAASEFDDPVVIDVPDLSLRRIALGDLNHDGRTDLAVSGISRSALSGWLNRLVIFYQDPASGLLLPAEEHTVTGNALGDITIADINSDGLNDVVVLADWLTNPERGTVSIWYQNRDGSLMPEYIYDEVPVRFMGEVHVADMDGDGDNDLVVQTGNLTFAVIRQDTSTVPGTLSRTPDLYTVTTTYWGNFEAFAIGDVNGDGRNDVVVLDPGNSGYLNVFLQGNAGALNPPVLSVPWGAALFGIEIADVDGDGLQDILGETSGTVHVLFQNPDHTFQPSVSYPFPTISFGGSLEHQALSVGDVTGDGRPDAVVSWSNEGVFILENGFPGHWPPAAAQSISPFGPIADSAPAYTWSGVPGATWYYLWVNDAAHAGRVQQWVTAPQAGCAIGAGTCSVTPAAALATGAAQWWVQTWSDADGYGPWSDGRRFTVTATTPPPAATLLAPTGTIGATTPTYTWTAVATATWYHLWVNDASGSGKLQQWYPATALSCSSGTCSVAPGTLLAPGSATWWIQTWNEAGYGPWSGGMAFTVPALGVPPAVSALLAPTGVISTSTPTYTWTAVPTSTWYYLWVNDPTGTKLQQWYPASALGCASGTCRITPASALALGSATWWVQSWNSAGYGNWSGGMGFTVGP